MMKAGAGRVVLDFLAQVPDVDAEELGLFRVFHAPDAGKDLAVGDDPVGVLRQKAKDAVFQAG